MEVIFWWWLLQFVGSWNKPLCTIILPVSPNLSTLFKSKSLEECYISRKDEVFCSSFANWYYQETWNLNMGIQTLFLECLYSMRSCPKMVSSYLKVFTFQQQLKIWCHCPRSRRTLQNLSLGWSVSYQIKNRKYTPTPGKYLLTNNWCYEKKNLNSSSSYLTKEVNLALSFLVCASQAVIFEILLLL